MDYNKTINLPKTDFPMRAGLPKQGAGDAQALAGHGPLQRAAEEERGQAPLPFTTALRSPTADCTWAMP